MPTKKDDDKKLPKRGAKKAKADAGDAGVEGETSNVVELRQPEPKSKKPSGRKQQLIPGTEPPHFAEIDDAATHYHAIKCKRAALSVDEKEARASLLEVMRKHDVSVYKFEDEGKTFVARIKPGDDKAEVKESEEATDRRAAEGGGDAA